MADRGVYLASESTLYRVLRAEDMQHHRGRTRPPSQRPREHVADGSWQVASWDITYLKSHVRGQFFYLYMVEDVWSRKIVAWVHEVKSAELAAALVERIRAEAGADFDLRGWVLHSDNGGPMKGATMLATLQRLGVVPSFSRPRVSDSMPKTSVPARAEPLHLALALAEVATLAALAAACGGGGGTREEGEPDASAPDAGLSVDASVLVPARAQSGGEPGAIGVDGDLAFVPVGPRLTVWRVPATPGGPPELVGESEPVNAVLRDLTLAGTRAFVSDQAYPVSRVHVFDISDPAHPVETASFALTDSPGTVSRASGMAHVGDRLYIADVDLGIAEVDVSDPDAPSVLRIVSPPSVALDVVGRRLYHYSLSDTVGALDLDADLASLGSVSPTLATFSVRVAPGDLLVGVDVDGVFVQDVSNLATRVQLFRDSSPDLASGSSIAVSGAAAWIAADDAIHVLDLADPAAIARFGPFPPASPLVRDVAHDGDRTLLEVTPDGRLVAIDVANAAAEPVVRGAADVTLCFNCAAVAVSGDLVVASNSIWGLRTGRLADLVPTGSSESGELAVLDDLAISEGRVYAADFDVGLRIYDVADPAAPTLVGQLDTGTGSSVAVVGERVYLAQSRFAGALRIIDATDPAAPRELGSIQTDQAFAVEVRGDLAFLAESASEGKGDGLHIYDVADPGAIEEVGVCGGGEGCPEAIDVALTGSLAVVACRDRGFHVVDVSDPARPVLRAIVPGDGRAVAAWEGGAALGGLPGVDIIDLADPDAPVVRAHHPTADGVTALVAPGNGQVVAASFTGGIYRFQLP